MTCINDVRLVGFLTKAPEFHTTTAGKRFARLSVQTEKYVKASGQSKRIVQVHTVVCFNQFSLDPLQQHGRENVWVKVLGELTYDRNGKAEIMVSQYSGEVGFMAIPGAEDSTSRDPAPSASAAAAPRGTGGLGRLPKSDDRREDESERDAPSGASGGHGKGGKGFTRNPNQDVDLDDEIPF